MTQVKFLIFTVFALISIGKNLSHAAAIDGLEEVPPTNNPAATQAVYKSFSNFTSIFNEEILMELGDDEWNAAFNFSSDTRFLSNCIQKTKACPLGSYCPLATLNKTTGVCDPYRYQLPPGHSNHSCSGADIWADIMNGREVFCPAGFFCPSTIEKRSCEPGHYCRTGSTSQIVKGKGRELDKEMCANELFPADECWNRALSFLQLHMYH